MDPSHELDPRRQSVLGFLPLDRPGLEIAPYFNPFLDSARHDVFYVDCIGNAEIQAKAAGNPGAAGCKIPKIDAVWVPGKPLKKCVRGRMFGYAVASHVMEHVPNPLGWLGEILECLEEGGVLALLLPDRRGTMDYYRRETTFAEVVGWSIEQPAHPTPTQVMDFLSQSFMDTGAADFKQMPPFHEAPRHYSDRDALDFARMVKEQGNYLDTHVSVWTSESFTAVFERVVALGLLPARIMALHRSLPGFHPAEFLVLLRKTPPQRAPCPTPTRTLKPLVLHIGAMKTGSSALQVALTQHPRRTSLDPDAGHVCEYASLAPWALLRGEVLRSAGLRSASLYSNSAGLEAIVKEDPCRRSAPLAELKRMRTQGIVPILSHETWLHDRDYVHEFASLLDAPLHVVAYVCPQTAWLNSLFWQTTALGQQSLESFISKNLPRADWALCLEAWQTAPGVEKLSIRLKCHDIVPDFCGLLECESLGEGEVWNPGFPMALARYMDRWNLPVFFRDGLMKEVFSRWTSASGTEGGIPHSLGPAPWVLAPSHIKQVVERFAEGNRRMLEWCEPAVAEKIRNDPRWWSTDPADHPPQNFEFIPSPEGRRGVPGRRIEPRAELLGDLLFEADKLVESLLGALVKADEALRSAELKAAELARKTGEKSF